MGSFLGFTAVQWQNGSRVALGVLVLSTLGLVMTQYAQLNHKWWVLRRLGAHDT